MILLIVTDNGQSPHQFVVVVEADPAEMFQLDQQLSVFFSTTLSLADQAGREHKELRSGGDRNLINL